MKVKVYADNAALRRGGSTRGPNNIIKRIGSGEYEALYQCAGQDVSEGGYSNYWWVKIVAGADQGWVSAVLSQEATTTSRSRASIRGRRCSP